MNQTDPQWRCGAGRRLGRCPGRLVLFVVHISLAAGAFTVPSLPAPEFVDTEVTAHHRLEQAGWGVRGLDFSLSFTGTPSNNVEVAFGSDADGNGELAPHETDVIVGWKCGRYFIGRFRTGETFLETAVWTNGMSRSLDWHYALVKNDRHLKSFAVTNEVGAVFTNLSSRLPAWVYDRSWNLMRLTARGTDVQNERFSVEVGVKGFAIELR